MTNITRATVTPIDTATNTAGTPIPVGMEPSFIAITPNGATAYAGGYSTSAVGQTSFVLVNMLATNSGAFTGTVDYWVIG